MWDAIAPFLPLTFGSIAATIILLLNRLGK